MAVELLKERFNMKGQGNRQEFSIHKMEAVVLGKYWYQAFVLYWYWVRIGIVKMFTKLLVLVLLRRFPKVLVLLLGRNCGCSSL